MPRKKASDTTKAEAQLVDEPGMEERFQRTLRNLINTPPKHRTAPAPMLQILAFL